VKIEGGIAQNVVPAAATCELNYRFAPGRSVAEAETRLRELVPAGELEVLSGIWERASVGRTPHLGAFGTSPQPQAAPPIAPGR